MSGNIIGYVIDNITDYIAGFITDKITPE